MRPSLRYAAAKEYGLQILAMIFRRLKKNYTRFWVLGNTVPEIPLNQIDFTRPYRPCLASTDLTKIESRPLKTVLGEYFFIIDCDYTKESWSSSLFEELTAVGIGYKNLAPTKSMKLK